MPAEDQQDNQVIIFRHPARSLPACQHSSSTMRPMLMLSTSYVHPAETKCLPGSYTNTCSLDPRPAIREACTPLCIAIGGRYHRANSMCDAYKVGSGELNCGTGKLRILLQIKILRCIGLHLQPHLCFKRNNDISVV